MENSETEQRMLAVVKENTLEEALNAGVNLAVTVHLAICIREGLLTSYDDDEGDRLCAAIDSVFDERTQELRAKQAMKN